MADLNKILIEFTEFLELHGAEGIRKGVEMYAEEFAKQKQIDLKADLFVDLKLEKQELLDACKFLWKEADDLRKHTADNFFIDWEDPSIEGTEQFTKALDNAYKIINKYR